jgi:DNA processing protein
MNSLQIIALQKFFHHGEILALDITCGHGLGRMPENPVQWVQVIDLMKEEGVFQHSVSVSELRKAFSDAQRIVDDSEEQDIGIVSYFDGDFPEPLKRLKQKGKNACPLILYYRGNIRNVSETEAVAIIGTRHPSADGLKMGEYCGRYYAGQGYNIVSGLAAGCDTAAHRGALKAKGLTAAIVAHGLDTVHPSQNEALAEQIIENDGAIISEYPVGTPSSPQNLVERNRLQAGLADAVILVQSDIKKGGSMHAVNTAIENHKPVFALRFDSEQANRHPMSAGNLKLIGEKKALALTPGNVEDVINAINTNAQ